MSDLQRRSMQRWRDQGYLVTSVEHRKQFPAKGKRPCPTCRSLPLISIAVDMFNCFDLLAIGNELVFIQVTDRTSASKRREKILASPEAKICAASGFRILLETWKKEGRRWKSSEEWITIDRFPVEFPITASELYAQQEREKLPEVPLFPSQPELLAEDEIPF